MEESSEDITFSTLLFLTVVPISYVIFRRNNRLALFSVHSLRDKKAISQLVLMILLMILNVNLFISFSSVLYKNSHIELYFINSKENSFGLRTTPITRGLADCHFKPVELKTFSNMEDIFDIEVAFPKDNQGGEESLKEFYHLKCPRVSFFDSFSLSASTELTSLDKPDELLKIRNIAKDMHEKKQYPLLKLAFLDGPDESLEYILERKWFKFCTAPIWMDKYGVYIALNRVTYCPNRVYKEPKISLLYAQLFDKDWNELEDYTINDINGEPIVFPTIFPAQMDEFGDRSLLGPEDPRVIIRDYYNDKTGEMDQEPVIIFNTLVKSQGEARCMHIYRPFTHRTKTVRMDINNVKVKFAEKNWSPFFNTDKDFIYFIYGLLPFRVLKCNIHHGVCLSVTGPEVDPNEETRELSGSSNLMEIPANLLPSDLAKYRKIWFGIIRSHIYKCGCLEQVYRFHGVLISTRVNDPNDLFTIDYITSLLDFNINPEAWDLDLEDYKCSDGKSVLIPNSVAYWDFIPKNLSNSKNQYGEDIMGIAFSEADKNNKVIHIKGWFSHLSKVLTGNKYQFRTHYLRESKNVLETDFLGECAVEEATEYCLASEKKYEWSHKPGYNATEIKLALERAKKVEDRERNAKERKENIESGDLTDEEIEYLLWLNKQDQLEEQAEREREEEERRLSEELK
ncbi:hypothetical protein DFJ63DRAFT_310129 [Scheffersomyces coipomensis]|uniref:uncharacterized protein n=1 Tax=Scheffersomyces coipomensis TaxID=1788519 RepID=UPI00315DE382